MRSLFLIILLILLTTSLLAWAQDALDLGSISLKVKPKPLPLIEQLLEDNIAAPAAGDLDLQAVDPVFFDNLDLEVWLD